MSSAVRVIVKGRVQGVGYRAWTVRTASGLGLAGWVRNLSDGTVEAVFSGGRENVFSMLDACRKGPMLARVETVEHYDWFETIEETAFVAKPTE